MRISDTLKNNAIAASDSRMATNPPEFVFFLCTEIKYSKVFEELSRKLEELQKTNESLEREIKILKQENACLLDDKRNLSNVISLIDAIKETRKCSSEIDLNVIGNLIIIFTKFGLDTLVPIYCFTYLLRTMNLSSSIANSRMCL